MGWQTAIGSTIREGGGPSVRSVTEKQKVGYEEITEKFKASEQDWGRVLPWDV
jgi:hypothetical protein